MHSILVLNLPRIALIGAGKFGVKHLSTLQRLSDEGKCELVGVVESHGPRAQEIRSHYDCRVEESLEDIMPEVDTVDIVVPASLHYDLVKKCLDKGKHVMVEKPLAYSFDEAYKLYNLSLSRKCRLKVGYIFRYDDMTLYAKKLIAAGRIGNIILMDGDFTNPSEPRNDVGAILNYSHFVDLCYYYMKSLPQSLSCVTYSFRNSTFEDDATILLQYENNTHARLHLGWIGRKKHRWFKIIGSKSTIYSDYLTRTVEVLDGEGNNINTTAMEWKMDPTAEPLYRELNDFIVGINSERKIDPTMYGAIVASLICERCIRSANQKKPIDCMIPTDHPGGKLLRSSIVDR